MTLQVKGDGPIEGITVTADSKGRVKGYVGNPDVIIPANANGKLDVSGAVGNGFLQVIIPIMAPPVRRRPSAAVATGLVL